MAVVIAAWLLPLPGLVLSEDQFAADRTPQLRTEVEAARNEFLKAQQDYSAYIQSHDVGAVRLRAEDEIEKAKHVKIGPDMLSALHDALAPVSEYAGQLHKYAIAGEAYLAKLREYDDNLMAWTRSLGSGLERLRNETWPFVEYLKRYPPPVGEKADPPMVTAAQVFSQTSSLNAHIEALTPDENTPEAQLLDAINAINADIAAIWSSGRSVENLGSLHDEYRTLLQAYDAKVQAAATGQGGGSPSSRIYLATTLDIVIGLFVVVGVAGLLIPAAAKSRLGGSALG
jgi:hypothetical protein